MPEPTHLSHPILTADGSYSLYNKRYSQSFHSDKGALTESLHVFVEGCDIAGILQEPVRVLEVGFGTGLNFFLTASLCLKLGKSLHYEAFEQELLSAEILESLAYRNFSDLELFESYLEFRRDLTEPLKGRHSFHFGSVTLQLLLGEATAQDLPQQRFQAIYLDAFSPEANPELWSSEFLAKLYAALERGGKLASYCVKGEVRRRLKAPWF
ncbi:MAG: tRNA (5-methylaminomethyl-2-thiouridine)(34)-methyltransferase MnmD [Deinococcales bacterium]